jgi:hypothetical protein
MVRIFVDARYFYCAARAGLGTARTVIGLYDTLGRRQQDVVDYIVENYDPRKINPSFLKIGAG